MESSEKEFLRNKIELARTNAIQTLSKQDILEFFIEKNIGLWAKFIGQIPEGGHELRCPACDSYCAAWTNHGDICIQRWE